MNDLIKELAVSMAVSESDVMCLAQSVANSITQDKVQDAYLNASEEDSIKLTEAYVMHANKKMQSFVSTYQTKPEARGALQLFVLNDLRACAE